MTPDLLQLFPTPGCRSRGRCLRECWLLIGSRPSLTFFQTFPNIFTTLTLLTPKCWLLKPEGSILVSTWAFYFAHHTTHVIHALPPLTSQIFKNGTPYISVRNMKYSHKCDNYFFLLSIKLLWSHWTLHHFQY